MCLAEGFLHIPSGIQLLIQGGKREYPIVLLNGHRVSTVPIVRPQWGSNSEILPGGANGILRVKSYPKYCFDVLSKRYEDVERLLLKEDLVQTYLKVIKRLPDCIEVACALFRVYAETKFLAEGKKKSTTFAWDDWRLKRAALLMAWETDYCFIKELLYKHKEFAPIADDWIKIYDFLEALYPNDKSSKETFGENKRLSEFKK